MQRRVLSFCFYKYHMCSIFQSRLIVTTWMNIFYYRCTIGWKKLNTLAFWSPIYRGSLWWVPFDWELYLLLEYQWIFRNRNRLQIEIWTNLHFSDGNTDFWYHTQISWINNLKKAWDMLLLNRHRISEIEDANVKSMWKL